MATRVTFSMPEREIQNTGITFKRKVNLDTHGELTIRQNHIDWRPKGYEHVYRLTWKELAEFAMSNDRRIKPRATAVKSKKNLKPSS